MLLPKYASFAQPGSELHEGGGGAQRVSAAHSLMKRKREANNHTDMSGSPDQTGESFLRSTLSHHKPKPTVELPPITATFGNN